MSIDLLTLIVAAKLVLLSALVLSFAAAHFRGPSARAALASRRNLVLFACLGALAFTNFGAFQGAGSSVIHAGDMYHYYFGSKYIHELGYEGLYEATLEADATSSAPAFGAIRFARDLGDSTLVEADQLRGGHELRARFTADRWASFQRDLSFFAPLAPMVIWQNALADHGYNAPPTRTVVTTGLVNALGDANWFSLGLIAFLDPLLLALMIGVVYATYGPRTAVVLTVFMGGNVLSSFDWIGGSFLRYSWLVMSVLGVCALKRDRFLLAGLLLGGASLFRIFPAFLALGVVVHGLWGWLGTGEWKRSQTRYLTGLGLSAALLVVPAVLLLGGVELWQAYFAKISLHVSGFGANQVGLRTLLDGSPVLLWIARGLIAGAFVLSVRQVSASQAAILGGVLIYAFGYLSNYYYCLLAVFCLWDELPVARLRSVVRCGALFAIPGVCAALIVTSTAEIAVYDKPAYFAASLACLAACTLLFVELLGGQLLGLLYAAQRLLRRWGSSVLRPLRPGRVHGRPVGLAARNALINSLTKLLVFRPKP